MESLTLSLPYISAGNMPGGKYSYFDVIMMLHIISYKIITTVGIYTYFSSLFEAFGSMSEIMFNSDSMSKKYFFNS